MVGLAFARTEDNARSQRDFLRHIPPLRQPHQFLPLLWRDFDRLRPGPHAIEHDIKLTNGKDIFTTGH
jgi:hypothetical protein